MMVVEMQKYKILLLSGCPVSAKILGRINEALNKIAKDKILTKIIDTQAHYSPIAYLQKKFTFKSLFTLFKRLFGNRDVWWARYIMDVEKPDIIVVGDEAGINTTFINIANMKKIPTIAIQVGMLTPNKRKDFTKILRWRKYLLWRLFSKIISNFIVARILLFIGWRFLTLEWGLGGCKRYAVMGEYYKRLLLDYGVPASNIVVTGYVLYDDITRYFPSEKMKIRVLEKLSLNPKQKIIVFLTQPLVEDKLCTFEKYSSIVTQIAATINNKYQLLIKPHPREKKGKYESLLKKRNNIKILSDEQDINLFELISIADIVTTFYSTTALIAFTYKKPLILLDLFQTTFENILPKYAIGIHDVSKFRTILSSLDKIIDHFNYDNFISEHLYKLDGRAALRVAEIIMKALTGNNNAT